MVSLSSLVDNGLDVSEHGLNMLPPRSEEPSRGEKSFFFSKSQFRSVYFVFVTLVGLTCVATILVIAYKYHEKLGESWPVFVILVLGGILRPWWDVLRYHQIIRLQLKEVSTDPLEESSSARDALLCTLLEVAESMMTGSLCLSLLTMLLLLSTIAGLLRR